MSKLQDLFNDWFLPIVALSSIIGIVFILSLMIKSERAKLEKNIVIESTAGIASFRCAEGDKIPCLYVAKTEGGLEIMVLDEDRVKFDD